MNLKQIIMWYISEMIHIKTQGNDLNSVDDIECLDSSYFNLLTKIFDNT